MNNKFKITKDKWIEIRGKGFTHFVLSFGLLKFGLFVGFIGFSLQYIFDVFIKKVEMNLDIYLNDYLYYYMPTMIFTGLFAGIFGWAYFEVKYKFW